MTERRIKILQLLCDGKVHKEIASELDLHISLIHREIASIKRLLAAATTAQLVFLAIKRGHIATM